MFYSNNTSPPFSVISTKLVSLTVTLVTDTIITSVLYADRCQYTFKEYPIHYEEKWECANTGVRTSGPRIRLQIGGTVRLLDGRHYSPPPTTPRSKQSLAIVLVAVTSGEELP